MSRVAHFVIAILEFRLRGSKTMCLVFRIRAPGDSDSLLRTTAEQLPAGCFKVQVIESPWWKGLTTSRWVEAQVSETGGCACSLLSDNADWNAEFWSMRPEVLEPLAATLQAVVKGGISCLTVEAVWNAEQASLERRMSLEEFIEEVRAGRIRTRTRYQLNGSA